MIPLPPWLTRLFPLAAQQPEEDRRHAAGRWGEKQAELYLGRTGMKILERRFRVGRRDEIDLIARDRDTLVFIEVKTRRNEAYGRPLAAVDRKKRHALSRAAVRYLKRLNPMPAYFRFDIVEVMGEPDGPTPEINHVKAAFTLNRCYRVPLADYRYR